jgi:AraC-like DNA-binding protein/mannose-6-phosphate isomerase-like protein (cupin superfamily)
MDQNITDNFFTADSMFVENKKYKIFALSSSRSQSGETLHSHDYMQIWFVTKGICNHWIEGNEHHMVKGDAFILPPFITHKTTLEHDSEILCCEFSLDRFLMMQDESEFTVLKETLMDLSFMTLFLPGQNELKPKFTLIPKNQIQVENLMRSSLEEYESNNVYSEQFIRVHILEILLIFAREYCNKPTYEESTEIYNKYKSTIDEIIVYINQNYEKPLTLEDACKIAMISKTYFCYLFKMTTHQTFVSYLLGVRIQQAVKLLETTNLPITQICYDVGFNDLSHFSRIFKSIVGVSARTYRTMKKNK